MLDQPPYEASLDNSFASTGEYANLFVPQQIQERSDDSDLLIFIVTEEPIPAQEENDSVDEQIPSFPDKTNLKKRKKMRIPHWNAHKQPKKYKGKCPFF